MGNKTLKHAILREAVARCVPIEDWAWFHVERSKVCTTVVMVHPHLLDEFRKGFRWQIDRCQSNTSPHLLNIGGARAWLLPVRGQQFGHGFLLERNGLYYLLPQVSASAW